MTLKIINLFYGYYKVSYSIHDRERVLNKILESKMITWGHGSDSTCAILYILKKDQRYFTTIMQSIGVEYEIVREYGIPGFLKKYRRRYGVIVGVLLFASILFFSSMLVWNIEVSGNESVSTREILHALEEKGLKIGSYIPSVNTGQICTPVMLGSDEVSWMTINFDGCVAKVEIIETKIRNEQEEKTVSNIVSAYDAVISEVSTRHGYTYVKEGDTVKKGQLLIGGVYDAATKVVMLHADGSVIGKVTEHIKVEIEKQQVKKSYSTKGTKSMSVVFFGREINIFSFYGKVNELYDTIEKEDVLVLFHIIKLPIKIKREVFVSCEESTVVLNEVEQTELAMSRMYREIAKVLATGELESKSLRGYFDGEVYVVECMMEVSRDIGINININSQVNK